jgi:hypothetical protein
MPDITIDQLRENIAEYSLTNDGVAVTFHCPVSGRVVHAVAPLRSRARAQGQNSTPTGLINAARHGFTRVFRGVLGEQSSAPAPSTVTAGEAEVDAAIVDAFRGVADQFTWDAEKKVFLDAATAGELMTEFDRQLVDAPIVKRWDRRVTARMLAEIAAADGKVTEEEREFFGDCLNSEVGDLDKLLETEPLNRIELEETTPGVRGTMLMLAFAIAMCDEELAEKELIRAHDLAEMLGLSKDREDELRHCAAEKIIENMLGSCYAHDELTPEAMQRISELGDKIGVNQGLVAKIDVRLRKRRGI